MLVLANFGALDDHVCFRHILMKPCVAGFDLFNLVNHVHAFNNLAEDAVAPAIFIGSLIVEEGVITDVNEELGSCRARVGGARHGLPSVVQQGHLLSAHAGDGKLLLAVSVHGYLEPENRRLAGL